MGGKRYIHIDKGLSLPLVMSCPEQRGPLGVVNILHAANGVNVSSYASSTYCIKYSLPSAALEPATLWKRSGGVENNREATKPQSVQGLDSRFDARPLRGEVTEMQPLAAVDPALVCQHVALSGPLVMSPRCALQGHWFEPTRRSSSL